MGAAGHLVVIFTFIVLAAHASHRDASQDHVTPPASVHPRGTVASGSDVDVNRNTNPHHTAVDVQYWTETSLARVMPNATGAMGVLPDPHSASIDLAGNEHESVQVAIRSPVNMSWTVEMSPLMPNNNNHNQASPAGLDMRWEQVCLR